MGDGSISFLTRLQFAKPSRNSARSYSLLIWTSSTAELGNTPATDLMKGYPPEIKLWWDDFGASSWGSRSEDSPALAVAYEMQFMAGPNRKDDRQTWPGGIGALSKRLVEVLQAKHADRMLTNATIVAVVTGKDDVQCYLHGRCGSENCFRQGRHHGHAQSSSRGALLKGCPRSRTRPCSRCATSHTLW